MCRYLTVYILSVPMLPDGVVPSCSLFMIPSMAELTFRAIPQHLELLRPAVPADDRLQNGNLK